MCLTQYLCLGLGLWVRGRGNLVIELGESLFNSIRIQLLQGESLNSSDLTGLILVNISKSTTHKVFLLCFAGLIDSNNTRLELSNHGHMVLANTHVSRGTWDSHKADMSVGKHWSMGEDEGKVEQVTFGLSGISFLEERGSGGLCDTCEESGGRGEHGLIGMNE